jgi:hypothetical protein
LVYGKKVERWEIAQERLNTYDLVIFDGDIYQPFSYNWCFDFDILNQSLEFLTEFYRKQLLGKKIGFPDKYFYLYTNQENLKYRKENDITRNRGNFNKHLGIVEPHKRFYTSLNDILPNYVQLIEAKTITNNVNIIDNMSSPSVLTNSYSIPLFDSIVDWLTKNKA